jgi:hypothetical protein
MQDRRKKMGLDKQALDNYITRTPEEWHGEEEEPQDDFFMLTYSKLREVSLKFQLLADQFLDGKVRSWEGISVLVEEIEEAVKNYNEKQKTD